MTPQAENLLTLKYLMSKSRAGHELNGDVSTSRRKQEKNVILGTILKYVMQFQRFYRGNKFVALGIGKLYPQH